MSSVDKIVKQEGWVTWLKLLLLIGIIVLLVAVLYFNNSGFSPRLDSKITHYAVAITNGQMFYGHPESVGNGVLVLTDVYYVVRQANPQTNQVQNTLISRRKSEWHSPDRMILNASNILIMEPVDPGSSVAKLIAEQKTK